MPCSTSPRVCFILTQPELYAIKLSKKYFAGLCSKLTLVTCLGTCCVFSTVSSCNCISNSTPDKLGFKYYNLCLQKEDHPRLTRRCEKILVSIP